MAKALFVCYRNKNVPSQIKERVSRIEKAILPDNLAPNLKDLVIDNGTLTCIFNPVALKQREGNSICLGITSEKYWWESNNKNKVFDGSYAIFREDEDFVELQTDAVASRSIWYYKDDEKLIASNSQLAIIYFLGDFKFNEKVIPWMLSSGTLGPYFSWDSRIKLLKPQTILSVNKDNWTFDFYTKPIEFINNPKKLSFDENLKILSNAIDASVNHLPENKNLLLPLSGGYDSRGILLALEKNNKKLPTITWGSKKAIKQKENDAFIAKQLAEYYELNHTYVHTDNPNLDAKTVIDRFIINSEGRTDNIAGYMDGFKIWNDIYESDHTAIVRGDEGFGWISVYSEQHARVSVGLNLIRDFNQLKGLNYKQTIPIEYERNTTESIEEWRDRIYQSFRLPIVLGALNETKSAYSEIINPLLSYSILEIVRKLPNKLRNDKNLFKFHVETRNPPITFAKKGANIDYRVQLNRKDIIEHFISTINNNNNELIDKELITQVISNIYKRNNSSPKRKGLDKIKGLLPNSLKSYLKVRVKSLNHLDDNLLLFRMFIIYKMSEEIEFTLKEMRK